MKSRTLRDGIQKPFHSPHQRTKPPLFAKLNSTTNYCCSTCLRAPELLPLLNHGGGWLDGWGCSSLHDTRDSTECVERTAPGTLVIATVDAWPAKIRNGFAASTRRCWGCEVLRPFKRRRQYMVCVPPSTQGFHRGRARQLRSYTIIHTRIIRHLCYHY